MTLQDSLSVQGITLRRYTEGTAKILCPKCSHTRKNKTEPCLSVTVDAKGAVWICHNCEWSGSVSERPEQITRPIRHKRVKPTHNPGSLPDNVVEWFGKRAVPPEVLQRNRIGCEQVWMPGCKDGETTSAITFPYLRGGEILNVKYRANGKRFRQVKDAEKIYYGPDDIADQETVIVCEGELDKLALEVAGFLNVVSVSDGAPAKVKDEAPSPEDDRKFEYVWNCREAFEAVIKIILATDGDAPGAALAEELARRYGKHRCWRVSWPALNDAPCKDANETLVQHGADVLREVLEHAQPYPIKSLYSAGVFESDVIRLYRGEVGQTFSTGWEAVDHYYRVHPGELAIVTGVPNSGKSQFMDALTVNMMKQHGWRIAYCSFENSPAQHLAKLAEISTGAPFWDGPTPRMTEDEVRAATAWLDERAILIRAEDEAPTLDWILETAAGAVLRYGIKGLVIDPYNEVESRRPSNMTETEYVSALLSKVKRFAQAHGVAVWFVAHPAKLYRTQDGPLPVPSLYNISCSANWVNKADVGIVVVRDWDTARVDIHVKKVRFKEVGHIGKATLYFDKVTGRYNGLGMAA